MKTAKNNLKYVNVAFQNNGFLSSDSGLKLWLESLSLALECHWWREGSVAEEKQKRDWLSFQAFDFRLY